MFSTFLRVAFAALFYVGAVVSAFAGLSVAAVATFAAFVLMAAPAAAASIDFAPLVEVGFSFANELLVGLAVVAFGYGAALLKRKTGIDLAIMQQGDNAMLHNGIQRGVDALERAARAQLRLHGRTTIDVKNPIVTSLANRMLKASPDLLKRMGVTESRLKELVVEHLQAKIINEAA